jgi:hypothetical protein
VLCTDRLIKNKNHDGEHLNMHKHEIAGIHESKESIGVSKEVRDKEALWMQRSITKIPRRKI